MTAPPVKTYRKSVVERRRLYLDYSCWLEEGETLTDTQVTVYPYTEAGPITVTSGYVDEEHKKLVMFVSGGIANTNYTLSMVVRTNAGQIKQDNIGLKVTE